jgi:hypothetical protein
MYIHFYLRNGIVYVPTVGKMGQGFYRDIEPVAKIPVVNTDALRRAIAAALETGNPEVPIPPRNNWPRAIIPKYAGVKSWSAFTKDMQIWGIDQREGIFSIIGKRTNPDGTTIKDTEQTISFPKGAEIAQVADRMVVILQGPARV